MKIQPPGGNGYKIPEQPRSDGPKKPGAKDPKLSPDDVKAANDPRLSPDDVKAGGPEAQELREVLDGVDIQGTEGMKAATDKIVDWVLKDSFGEDFLKTKDAEPLREAIRDQLLNDPNEAARLRRIVDQL